MTLTIPRLCASVSGRASPLGVKMHDAGYRQAGLDFKYLAIESQDLPATVKSLVTLGARGFGVSMPFKLEVISLLDEVSPDVRAIGACNTVVNDQGRLTGHNTDWRGAMDALSRSGVNRPERALVLGSGGAARALIYGLKETGWEVGLAARNEVVAAEIAREFRLPKPSPLTTLSFADVQLVVNATPVSDYPSDFLDLDRFPDAKAIFDVVFSPVSTGLCGEAERRGLTAVRGWQMLLHQAMHQFALYTGVEAPEAAMQDALLQNLK